MIYLDNAATSWPKPPGVSEAMTRFLAEDAGSPDRSGHRMAATAERIVMDVRIKLAKLFGVKDPLRIVFGLNCTDALNMALKGALREGDHVVTTQLEHNSILRPLRAMVDAGRITMTMLPLTAEGCTEPDAFREALTPATRMLATLHASNVTGIIQPISEIGRVAREADCLLLVDAAQSAGLVKIDVNAMNIDLLAFPGHKSLHGPTGTGGLYVGERADLNPWREGGTGGDSIHPTQPEEFPTWLEAGTPNVVGLAGLNAALEELDPPRNLKLVERLAKRLIQSVEEDERFRLVGLPRREIGVGVVSLVVLGTAPEEVAAILDESFDIAVRPGLHCAPFVHRALGTFPDGTVRVSPGPANTTEDIDTLLSAIRKIVTQLV